ncbi:hypothetical protein HDV64DRAFT_95169 [Trichoderma sp. TUCIM 5745]
MERVFLQRYIWFQTVKDLSAVQAGYRSFPLTGGLIISSVATGFALSQIGYTPFMIGASALMILGMTLIATLQPGSGIEE